MDIKKIKSFHTFIETSCDYKRSSQLMSLTIPGLRKQLFSLEAEIGVKLFQTQGKKTFPTREAHALYDKTCRIINDYNDVINYFDGNNASMEKPLIIGTTHAMASLWACDYLEGFLKTHPEANLSIFASDNIPDLVKDPIDLYIGYQLPDDHNLLNQHNILTYDMRLYASKDYIKTHGLPQSITELSKHKVLGFGSETTKPYPKIDWHLNLQDPPLKSYFNVNSGAGLLRAVELGLGIGAISDAGAELSKRNLVNVLPEVVGYDVQVFFSYPKYLENDVRVTELLKHLTHTISNKLSTYQKESA